VAAQANQILGQNTEAALGEQHLFRIPAQGHGQRAAGAVAAIGHQGAVQL
jgi:hypothetical protein